MSIEILHFKSVDNMFACIYQHFIYSSSYSILIYILECIALFLTPIPNLVFSHSITYSFTLRQCIIFMKLKGKKESNQRSSSSHQTPNHSMNLHRYPYTLSILQMPSVVTPSMTYTLRTNTNTLLLRFWTFALSLPLPSHLNHSLRINHALISPIVQPSNKFPWSHTLLQITALSFLSHCNGPNVCFPPN